MRANGNGSRAAPSLSIQTVNVASPQIIRKRHQRARGPTLTTHSRLSPCAARLRPVPRATKKRKLVTWLCPLRDGPDEFFAEKDGEDYAVAQSFSPQTLGGLQLGG